MIEKIDISNPSIAEEIRKNMVEANMANKGLLGVGKYGTLSFGSTLFQTFVLKLGARFYANLILSMGKYSAPSLVGIVMAEGGGSASVPIALNVKTLCGTAYVLEAKSFLRNGAIYMQIKMKGAIDWGNISFFCIYNQVKDISVDGSLEYNSSTDTNLVEGIVE